MERRYESVNEMVRSERKIAAGEARAEILNVLEEQAQQLEKRAVNQDVNTAAIIEGFKAIGLEGVTWQDVHAVVAKSVLRTVMEVIERIPQERDN